MKTFTRTLIGTLFGAAMLGQATAADVTLRSIPRSSLLRNELLRRLFHRRQAGLQSTQQVDEPALFLGREARSPNRFQK